MTHADRASTLALLGLLAGGCAGPDATDPVPIARTVAIVDRLAAPLATLTRDSRDPLGFAVKDGVPVAVTGRIPVAGATPLERAQRFVTDHAALYGTGAPPALRVRRSGTQRMGDRMIDHVVLRQQIDGVDVYAAELSILLDGSDVIAAGGYLLPSPPQVGTRPRTEPAAALATARRLGATGPMTGTPRLVVYDPRVLGGPLPASGRAHLAWQLAIGPELFLIDAHDEALVRRDDGKREISAQIYDSGVAGSPLRFDSNAGGCLAPPCNTEVNTAANSLTQTYDFYDDEHGWVGYDGDDADHEIYVRSFTTAYQGYFDEEFYFLTGFATVDVVGHEFTHGVIEHRSDLEYQYEPGALNESFADLMGNLIENENFEPGLVGENVPGGPVRDMCNPGGSNPVQPGHFDFYANLPGSFDNGGVHINSGIANRAWCRTSLLLQAKGDSQEEARDKMGDVAFALMGSLPAEATMLITASFAMSDFQNFFGAINSDPWGHACIAWQAWNHVGVTVNGPLTGHCTGVADSDLDGIGAENDNCPTTENPSQIDSDGDGLGDLCDDDLDGDGDANEDDNCVMHANSGQEDADGDGLGDACEDLDHDAVDDDVDNCVDVPNPGQEDADADFYGDACEVDNDGDGLIDDLDSCAFKASPNQTDTDGDGLGDICDPCATSADEVIGYTAGIPSLGIPPQPIVADSDGDGRKNGCDRSPWGNYTVNGIAGTERAVGPGMHAAIEGEVSASAPLVIAMAPCPRGDCAEYAEHAPVLIRVTNATGLTLAVVDDRGRVQARLGRGRDELAFAPRGGRRYRLLVRTPGATAQTVRFELDVSR